MSAGIHTAEYRRQRAEFKTACAEQNRPCHICHQPIDYTLGKEDPNHFQLDHIKSRKKFPHLEHDPSNWAPSHAYCNKHKSDNDLTSSGVGVTSEAW